MTIKEKLLRKASIIGGLFILVVGVFMSIQIASSNEKEISNTTQPKNRVVEVILVENKTIKIPITTTGKLKASQNVDIYSDVQGTLKTRSKPFKIGTTYKKGEVLLGIDDREAKLNLQTKKSNFFSLILSILPDIESDYSANIGSWNTYIESFDINKPIPKLPLPKSNQEKYYLTSKKIEYQYLGIKKEELTLSKYVVYAPFNGTLNEVSINPGTLVRTGQKLGSFVNENGFELEISVPSSQIILFELGMEVEVYEDNNTNYWKGVIKRIGKTLDENTQTLSVFVSLTGKGLYQGMYLNVDVNTTPVESAFVINRTLINKDRSIFIVQNETITSITPEIIRFIGNQVIVKNIPNKSQLVVSKTTGLRNGMHVEIIEIEEQNQISLEKSTLNEVSEMMELDLKTISLQ